MQTIKCRVAPFVDKFYLPDTVRQYVGAGAIVELDTIEARKQIAEGVVTPLSDAEAKILEAQKEGDNAILAERDIQIQQLMKENAVLKKKKSDGEELTLLKAQIAELTKQNELLQSTKNKK
jgi:hypothetical protein